MHILTSYIIIHIRYVFRMTEIVTLLLYNSNIKGRLIILLNTLISIDLLIDLFIELHNRLQLNF